MNINANLNNLIQQKKSVVLTRQSESNKIFKYIGGDSVIYKDLYVQSGTTGYAGHIYETGDTLSVNSQNIELNAASGVAVNGDLIMNSDLIMNPIAIGVDCGLTNQSTLSIAIGYQAGRNNQALDAIAIGDMAGNTAQGTFAIAIGSEAGRFGQNTSAIAIGTQSGSNTNALQGVNSICIGALARSTQANSIVLNASGAEFTASFASGFFVKPLRSNGGGNALNWNATTGEISQNTSQRVHKENIENLNTDTRVVLNLQPRTFTYKSNPTSGTHIGFIAEEVAEINPNFANYNVLGGEPVGINYNNITVFLLEEVKKLTNYVNLLKNALETLTGNPLVAPVVSEETPVAPEENPVAPEENPVIPEENPVAPQ